jgi:hypothetical protein
MLSPTGRINPTPLNHAEDPQIEVGEQNELNPSPCTEDWLRRGCTRVVNAVNHGLTPVVLVFLSTYAKCEEWPCVTTLSGMVLLGCFYKAWTREGNNDPRCSLLLRPMPKLVGGMVGGLVGGLITHKIISEHSCYIPLGIQDTNFID